MSNRVHKLIAVVLAFNFLLFALTSCSSTPETNKTSAPVTGKEAAAKEPPVTIKIYRPGVNLANSYDLIKEIGLKTNTNPVFIESGTEDFDYRVSQMITTGEDVDWVNVDQNQPFIEWGKNGLLVDLKPILEAHKNELKVLNCIAFSDTFKQYRGPNGEVYGIPCLGFQNNVALAVRLDWLEQLGLPVPDSLDAIYATLKKFKEGNLDGNGTVPFVSNGLYGFGWVFLAYGGMTYYNSMENPMYYKDGSSFKPYDISEMNKQALKYCRKLYQEGLVNSDFPTMAENTRATSLYGRGKAGMIYDSSPSREILYETDHKDRSIEMPAPKGPTGIQAYRGVAPLWLLATVPKGCKDPYPVLKLMEWMHSKEGRMLCVNGIAGVHYDINADGEISVNKYLAKRKSDFGDSNGTNPPVEWGYVSALKGYIDVDKYPKFEDAIKNMVLFKYEPKAGMDEDYAKWLTNANKYSKLYEYSAYNIEALKYVSKTVSQFVIDFYIKAITAKNFDIDAQWNNFVKEYGKIGGDKALKIFTDYMKENGK